MVSHVTPSKYAASVADILAQIRRSPSNVRFRDACKVNDHGKAKRYQVGQLLEAIEKLESENAKRGK